MRRGPQSTFLRLWAAALLTAVGAPSAAKPLAADPGERPGATSDPLRPLPRELRASVAPGLVIRLVGLVQPGTALPPAAAPAITLGFLDLPLIDPARPGPAPQQPASPYVSAKLAQSLRAGGFDGLFLASDRISGWGIEGLQQTEAALAKAGIAHAGSGDTAGLAAFPAFIDQPQGGGRIAFLSATTSPMPNMQALQPEGAANGRPGVFALEVATIRLVTAEQLLALNQIACRLARPGPQGCPSSPTEVLLLGNRFQAAAAPMQAGTTRYELNQGHVASLLRQVREGKQSADLLVLGLHAPQVEDARTSIVAPPTMLRQLAQAAIVAGADIVAITGRGAPGGIEFHAGATGRQGAILYGLGTTASGLLVQATVGECGLRLALQALGGMGETLRQVQAISSKLGTDVLIMERGRMATGEARAQAAPGCREGGR